MPLSPGQFPLRVHDAEADPVHAARSHPVKGHRTACLFWLDPKRPHIWCDKDAEITCANCIRRMGPPPVDWASARIPKNGALQERLAEVVAEEIRQDADVAWRIAETVERWRRGAEERVLLAVEGMLVDLIPDAARLGVARNLTEEVLRSMDIGHAVREQEEEGMS